MPSAFVLAVLAAAPLELVESPPVETTLDHPDIANAAEVWLEMVQGAQSSLDFAEFYATDHPGSRLEPVVKAVETAADRGVRVRFLADASFAKKERQTLERLEKHKGIEVLRIDWSHRAGGGIHHAKYFIVDRREAFLGSQNFDWRSLEHIQELGVRVRIPEVVRALSEVFEDDWAGPPTKGPHPSFPVATTYAGQPVRVWFEASPKGLLPDETTWTLPKLVELIDGAKKAVRVQVLTYQPFDKEGYFAELDTALRRAAGRGVEVSLLVSDWSKRPAILRSLQSLSLVPHVTVKFLTVPAFSGGFIPYARVIHAKYLAVDGERAWLGTSNWEGNYFFKSRNVGLVVDGASFAQRLDRFFLDDWNSAYVTRVEACGEYPPPRISE